MCHAHSKDLRSLQGKKKIEVCRFWGPGRTGRCTAVLTEGACLPSAGGGSLQPLTSARQLEGPEQGWGRSTQRGLQGAEGPSVDRGPSRRRGTFRGQRAFGCRGPSGRRGTFCGQRAFRAQRAFWTQRDLPWPEALPGADGLTGSGWVSQERTVPPAPVALAEPTCRGCPIGRWPRSLAL